MSPTTSDRIIPPGIQTSVVTTKLLVNDVEIPGTVRVISSEVYKELNRIPVLRLTIMDGSEVDEDFEISSQDLFIPGNKIELLAGYSTTESSIFKGVIVRHAIRIRTGQSRLLVECRDAAYRMTLQEKTRIFEEQTDSDIFSTILSGYEPTADVQETTSVQHQHLVQHRLTDWDFMVLRAEANGLVCLPDDGIFSVLKPDIGATPLAAPVFGASILELDAEIDGRLQPQALRALSWDPAAQKYAGISANEPGWSDNGNLSATDLASSTGAESSDLFHGGILANDEMQAWADGRLFRIRAAKIRGRVRLRGWNEVKPGITLDLQGLGDRMNGAVYVTAVRHEINAGNWVTDAQFGLDPEPGIEKFKLGGTAGGAALLPAISGLQIGVVTQLEGDPDSEQRILVKIPAFSPDSNGVWARVATLDAGKDRGTFFLPDIEDEVVLGFLDGDPRHAVVLGMLNSSAKPAPQTASDDNHLKGYVSRKKIKLTFDDEKVIVTLETPDGNKFALDDDLKSITMEDSNGNKIVLDSNGIAMESAGKLTLKAQQDVKVEGANLELKASAQFKAEGAAGAEVSTDAIAILKGATMVKIN